MQSEYDTIFAAVATNIRFYLFPVNRIDDFFKYKWHGRGSSQAGDGKWLDIYAMAEEEMGFE